MDEQRIIDAIGRVESKLDTLLFKFDGSCEPKGSTHSEPTPTIEINVTDKAAFLRTFGSESIADIADDLQLKFKTWLYRWQCDMFNSCTTEYIGAIFIIQKSTSRTLTWNLLESATRKSPGIPFWSTSDYYRYRRSASEIDFGFIEHNRTNYVSTCINCYADGYRISFRWDSNA